jgi:Ni/Fe-hydrogenase 1 B-type cytochrome subunit
MTTHDAVRAEATEIELGQPVAFGSLRPDDVVRLAAYGTPPGEGNVVERALVADASFHGSATRPQEVEAYRPATPERPWSETELILDGERWEIARGDPRALVEQLVHPSRGVQARAISESARLTLGAYRPLGVAFRTNDGPWTLAGYVPVRGWTRPGRKSGGRPFDYHPVWDLSLRISHWTWVAAIVVLTLSGYLLAQPQWIPAGYADPPTGFFVGYTRLVHLVAAVVLCLVLLVRAYGLTVSKIPYDRWKSLLPFRTRRDVHNAWKTLRGYLFIKPHETPVYFGHNPLQQLTYTSVYLILILQIATGFALWGLYDPSQWFLNLFGWLNQLLGTQQVRLLHYMIMWGLLVFIPAHVYLSVRADSVERMGAISSMVSGGRWVRRGAVFEDWPSVDGHNPPAGSAEGTQQRDAADR